MPDDSFCAFFKDATGIKEGPYPYQEKLAAAPTESRLIHVPTGAPGPPLRSGPPKNSRWSENRRGQDVGRLN